MNYYDGKIILFLNLLINLILCNSQCSNDCNDNGLCNVKSQCECFDGYDGYDCSQRVCPTGKMFSNYLRKEVECSGQGSCDTVLGQCKCYDGFTGTNCERKTCLNECSHHGTCVNLKTAGHEYNGWSFNHTSTYTLWDANILYGCQCDPGWKGYDCSIKTCDSGTDPRSTSLSLEYATLVCACVSDCEGLFKLRFMGRLLPKYLNPNSTGSDVANALMSLSRAYSVISNRTFISIVAGFNSTLGLDPVCVRNSTTRTYLRFTRQSGDIPAIGIYQNRISGGSLYFETPFTLACDCSDGCNGTFRMSYDGEMSRRMLITENSHTLRDALQEMQTVVSAGITVVNYDSLDICTQGSLTNHSFLLLAQVGNLPMITLWPSVAPLAVPWSQVIAYDSNNISVLSISSADGRNEVTSECCGVGYCHKNNGTCKCPPGWENDPDRGPCGKLVVKTSDWQGLSRCPGIVSYDDLSDDWTATLNQQYLYLSINPRYRVAEGPPNLPRNFTQAVIMRYPWKGYTEYARFPKPFVADQFGQILLNLTSNFSAGPITIDQSKGYLYYADNNDIGGMYIGRMSLHDNTNHTVWLRVSTVVTTMALDPHYDRRKLFWTSARATGVADGSIYWTYLDTEYPSINSLTSTIGQAHLVDPLGIAVHTYEKRIYWIDRNITDVATVLRSCDLIGEDYKQVYLYRNIDNITQPANVTDLKIDFQKNIVYFFDSNSPTAIIKTNLNNPTYLNSTRPFQSVSDLFEVRVVCDTLPVKIGNPKHAFLDGDSGLLLWTDLESQDILYYRYSGEEVNNTFGTIFSQNDHSPGWELADPKIFIGIALDDGMGNPRWGNYLDCYGHGRCLGFTGKWRCECYEGFYGDCQSKTCPKGPAWFSEPFVDNIAHDVEIECSNAGICDGSTGSCICNAGFEGSACERMTCPSQKSSGSTGGPICNGRGRCLSMRDQAKRTVDSFGDPSPYNYGSHPHNPSTWDADRVYGCIGDSYGYVEDYHDIKTYQGPYLDELPCLYGYDYRLLQYFQGNFSGFTEIQQLICTLKNGSFSLSFRGKASVPISSNASSDSLIQALSGVHTIGSFSINEAMAGYPICQPSGEQKYNITFLSEFGHVPLLRATYHNTTENSINAGVYINRLQSYNGTLYECSGHGRCDKSTGSCVCAKYWTSSDGLGNQGYRNDCGFYTLRTV